ncbi:uncharacterized protein LOC126554531 [Aphis gossypii]|uniref:uncharacterized protein LOC126554531 n=1 Tax=Aphis gossypii TaxID=80765 RepID=UPI0021591A67|nr:uncharacterized protein LOC126554531 [Aphis gossypii]
MQEKILDKLINNQTIIDYTECNYEEFLTPMESDEELEKMEDKIKTDLAYRKTVVTELSRLMGQNLSETIRKIMKKLFNDNLLTFYSYIGFKGKNNFQLYKLVQLYSCF